MKLRYYLRGLGLGIVVTAALLTSMDTNENMSDEQIRARAAELGMVESTVLADLEASSTSDETTAVAETESENVTEEESVTQTAMAETEEETVTEETVTTEAEENTEPESETETETEPETEPDVSKNQADNAKDYKFVVNKGEGSDTVARHLADAGIVEDAHEFDAYLMKNGYDKRISAGEHVIPKNATWEEIAKLLCNM